MEKISFLVDWGRDKVKSWSGTNYSIYKALSRYYDMRDVNIGMPFLARAFFRVLGMNGFSLLYYFDKINKNRAKSIKGKVFQFAEIRSDDKRTKTMIYQDMSVSFLKHLAENQSDIFAVCGFQNVKKSLIEKRACEQNEYYKNCAAIFTMGKWFTEFLWEQGIPREKIHTVGGG